LVSSGGTWIDSSARMSSPADELHGQIPLPSKVPGGYC
jgi:hypothetical protein